LIHLLHVGRNDQQGYFYYIMELGDDQTSGQLIHPEDYTPRDLGKEIKARGRFPVSQCLEWFIPLSEAINYLHQQGRIHRDIKPSNIIFVRGSPKLADIGLVTQADRPADMSYVGTKGYIPEDSPGTPMADLYALGKVMYETSTGQNCLAYPSLPSMTMSEMEMTQVLQLMSIVNRACHGNPRARYTSIAPLRSDLVRLQSKLQKEARSP
jgi:serine/threonine protein kinase